MISVKETWLGAAIILVTLALAALLRPVMLDKSIDNIKVYRQALRINDSNQFRYAQKTSVGNVLAYGEMQSLNDIYTPELVNPYAAIDRIDEEYTMHSRQVCTTDSKGNTTCRTEFYWTWDVVDTEYHISQNFKFLGVNFSVSQLNLPKTMSLHLDNNNVKPEVQDAIRGGFYIYEDGDNRHFYRVLPTKFNASVFVGFFLNKPEHVDVYYETMPQDIIDKMEAHMKFMNVFYFIGWASVVGILYFWMAYEVIEL